MEEDNDSDYIDVSSSSLVFGFSPNVPEATLSIITTASA